LAVPSTVRLLNSPHSTDETRGSFGSILGDDVHPLLRFDAGMLDGSIRDHRLASSVIDPSLLGLNRSAIARGEPSTEFSDIDQPEPRLKIGFAATKRIDTIRRS
jgi:hypothetical protein